MSPDHSKSPIALPVETLFVMQVVRMDMLSVPSVYGSCATNSAPFVDVSLSSGVLRIVRDAFGLATECP
ncbi:hypothetical protein BH24CHL4_BH24CHL4_20840 [soil metagenome]